MGGAEAGEEPRFHLVAGPRDDDREPFGDLVVKFVAGAPGAEGPAIADAVAVDRGTRPAASERARHRLHQQPAVADLFLDRAHGAGLARAARPGAVNATEPEQRGEHEKEGRGSHARH